MLTNIISKLRKPAEPTNSIFTMRVYRHQGMWVFDNPAVGLVKEPFVAGADTVFDHIAFDKYGEVYPADDVTIDIVFSDQPFPGWHVMAEHMGPHLSGDNYNIVATEFDLLEDHDLWLCPALRKYYADAPDKIFMRVSKISKA